MTIKELKEHLRNYPDSMPIAYALWLPDDVIETANAIGVTLNDEQIADVLHHVDNSHDANYGINWQTIESAINSLKQIEG